MNYKEFISFIQTTDINFNFKSVGEGCKIITEIDFDSISEIDYQVIKDFFRTASSLKMIPKEYDNKIDELIKKM